MTIIRPSQSKRIEWFMKRIEELMSLPDDWPGFQREGEHVSISTDMRGSEYITRAERIAYNEAQIAEIIAEALKGDGS